MRFLVLGGLSFLLLSGCSFYSGPAVDTTNRISKIELSTGTLTELIFLGEKKGNEYKEDKEIPIYTYELRIPEYYLSIKTTFTNNLRNLIEIPRIENGSINPNGRKSFSDACYPYPITLYQYTGTVEEVVQIFSQEFKAKFTQVVDMEKKFYDPRPRKRPEIFDGVSVWGKSIVAGVKNGTMIFYTRDEGYGSTRGDTINLRQRYLLFNTEYPNIVYHISSGGTDCRHPEMLVINFM